MSKRKKELTEEERLLILERTAESIKFVSILIATILVVMVVIKVLM